MPLNLDMDVLRTLVVGSELGGFAEAARRLGRSPSSLSMQLRRIEDQAGAPLFRKEGRRLVPTDAGEMLLGYARRIVDLNDEALGALRIPAPAGFVRLGLPQDVADAWLPPVLARFSHEHPGVRIDVVVERNAALTEGYDRGHLDVVALWSRYDATKASSGLLLPMSWIGQARRRRPEPVPLVLFASPCVFRAAGLSALDAAGIAWRVAFSSPSLSGLWAAVEGGLGYTVRTRHGMPRTLQVLGAREGLPALPKLSLSVRGPLGDRNPAAAALTAALRKALSDALAARKPSVGRRIGGVATNKGIASRKEGF